MKDYEKEVLRSEERLLLQAGWKAPLQDLPPEQQHCEDKMSTGDHAQELLQIKEEQEELWTSSAGEELKDTDTKESMFNIIYVQRSDEESSQSPDKEERTENEGDISPRSMSKQLKSDVDEGQDGAAETTGDCQTKEDRDGTQRCETGGGRSKSQETSKIYERPHNCSVCNKNFRIKSILNRHMKTHTGEKPYICSVCGKGFIQRSYMQTHMKTHSQEKPHTCRFCGRGFTQVGNMNAHIRIHTGEKPHSCTDCGKRFREKADLIKHMIIHTGEKPYTCSVCHMRFSAQSNLTRHLKTHSGERPYSCTVCGKGFLRRSHVNIHMKTHAGENL
ncbi:uncharacterized protein ACBR49_013649 [Aulostomus maculatus]